MVHCMPCKCYFVYYLLFTLDDIVLCLPQLCLCEWHSLIIPKSNFPSLEATLPSVIAPMCSKVPFISSAIVKATGSDSFNLLVNNGEATGQVIFHTHIHIIPCKARACLWASETIASIGHFLSSAAPVRMWCWKYMLAIILLSSALNYIAVYFSLSVTINA
ncbi:hypothetical protein UlMin_024292 [Ulmus minor]